MNNPQESLALKQMEGSMTSSLRRKRRQREISEMAVGTDRPCSS